LDKDYGTNADRTLVQKKFLLNIKTKYIESKPSIQMQHTSAIQSQSHAVSWLFLTQRATFRLNSSRLSRHSFCYRNGTPSTNAANEMHSEKHINTNIFIFRIFGKVHILSIEN